MIAIKAAEDRSIPAGQDLCIARLDAIVVVSRGANNEIGIPLSALTSPAALNASHGWSTTPKPRHGHGEESLRIYLRANGKL